MNTLTALQVHYLQCFDIWGSNKCIDDDEPFRPAFGEPLRLHQEAIPIEAATGADALEAAKSDYFDVIILDVGLPDMDGRVVCRLMRKNGVTSSIKGVGPRNWSITRESLERA